MTKTKPKTSPLRAYIDTIGDLPADALLGRLVLFTITSEEITHDDLTSWFADLGLDEKLMPMPNKAVDAFKKATSDTKDSYPMSMGRTAYLLCRDVTSNGEYIRRQITREIKDGNLKKLGYDEAVQVSFYRARGADQSTARLEITPNFTRLSSDEHVYVKQAAQDIYTRYESYLRYLDSQKIRGMVRDYLKDRLNAIEIKGGVYFVHVSRDDELSRLSELVTRLGGGCMMHQIPMVDLERERAFVVRTFEREAAQTLNDLTKEIELAQKGSVTPAAYNKLKARYDQVVANAEEHMLTLAISQDSTAASAEVAQEALAALAERMVSS